MNAGGTSLGKRSFRYVAAVALTVASGMTPMPHDLSNLRGRHPNGDFRVNHRLVSFGRPMTLEQLVRFAAKRQRARQTHRRKRWRA